MSRILTLIKVKEKDAVKITLDIKKHFVEENKTEVTQEELEQIFFQKLSQHNYSEHFVQRYQLITSFYQKKVPFVILVCGTECMGKSTLVTQLAERINISNILQTSIVKQVMDNFGSRTPPPELDFSKSYTQDKIIETFRNTCRRVRDGCNFDISKCFADGKPLIIDGSHIDPSCYI